MFRRVALVAVCWSAVCLPCGAPPHHLAACCPAPMYGRMMINVDQSVVVVWDAARRTQHFIRQANFRGNSSDFGFVVPSPSTPELAEAGDGAFPYLVNLTAPDIIYKSKQPSGGIGCGCGAEKSALKAPGSPHLPMTAAAPPPVRVLAQKEVAGFSATVLEADSSAALVGWLKENDYSFSPAIARWAKPYIDGRWKFTALKIVDKAKADAATPTADSTSPLPVASSTVDAKALRISFATERPLFPYREPDYGATPNQLGVAGRTLRIFFLAEGAYQGELTKENPWTGQVVWSDRISAAARSELLKTLQLPESTGPAEWWLTEFSDGWPYRIAPADLYFSPAPEQTVLHRPPIIEYVSNQRAPVDPTAVALVGLAALPLWRRRRRSAEARRRP
jgi:MYXO-CTERM domain-containing protein